VSAPVATIVAFEAVIVEAVYDTGPGFIVTVVAGVDVTAAKAMVALIVAGVPTGVDTVEVRVAVYVPSPLSVVALTVPTVEANTTADPPVVRR